MSTPDSAHEVQFSGLVDGLAGDTGDNIELIATIRDFPTFYEPLRPPPESLSLSAAQELSAARQAVRDERAETAELMSEDFRAHVDAAGGKVHEVIDWGGAVFFSYPVANLDTLKNRHDISFVEPADDPTVSSDQESCSSGEQSCYDDSLDNFLGRMRRNERVGVESYWDDGHDGSEGNSSWHSYGRMNAGVVEKFYFQDRSPCFLSDDYLCDGERIHGQFDCVVDVPSWPWQSTEAQCNSQSGWNETNQLPDGNRHGTSVTSAILADYRGEPSWYQDLGDPHFEDHNYHTSQWQRDATGMAPGAGLTFIKGWVSGYNNYSYAAAFDTVRSENVDVLNMSFGFQRQDESSDPEGESVCRPAQEGMRQNALAAAFDDGIFLVTSAGNEGLGDCNQGQPGSMPRVFAVNSLNMASTTCQGDYNNCPIRAASSSEGGADARIDGGVKLGAYSLTDVAAPTAYARTTRSEHEDVPNESWVAERDSDGLAIGSSHAAPIVSGSALVVKDYLLDNGYSWANSPGRLHVIMLSMADRWHHASNTRDDSGADTVSGFGRFKLRPIETGYYEPMQRWVMSTKTFTGSTPDFVKLPWSTPLPSNAELVKCTMNIPQDHRGTTDLADITLRVRVREPVDGQCEAGEGSLVAAESDQSFDTKHMASISDTSIAGNCIEYELINHHVPSGESQMTNTFCYSGSIDDNHPH